MLRIRVVEFGDVCRGRWGIDMGPDNLRWMAPELITKDQRQTSSLFGNGEGKLQNRKPDTGVDK